VKAGGSFENSFWKSMATDRHLGRMHNSRALLANSTNGRWSNYALNLLGDPEMEVWPQQPRKFHFDLPIEVAPDLPSWVMDVGEGLARVCIQDPRGAIRILFTGDLGTVTFSTRSFKPGDSLLITITKPGFVPYQSTVKVGGGKVPSFIRGDANADGATDVSDAIAILGYLFLAIDRVPCEQAGDANSDDTLDITDAIYLLSFLFIDGKPIGPPAGTCGIDPTGHSLPCSSFPGCR
jgi:hypothetical protein